MAIGSKALAAGPWPLVPSPQPLAPITRHLVGIGNPPFFLRAQRVGAGAAVRLLRHRREHHRAGLFIFGLSPSFEFQNEMDAMGPGSTRARCPPTASWAPVGMYANTPTKVILARIVTF